MTSRRLAPALVAAALASLLSPAPLCAADEVVRRFGRSSVRADVTHARPGGVIVVRSAGFRASAAWAILDGRRSPFFAGRALVPVAADAPAGTRTLGVEIRSRRGVQRLALPVAIAAAQPAGAARLLSPEAAALFAGERAVRDGRLLLAALRTASPRALHEGLFGAPVDLPPSLGFGAALSYVGQPAIGPRFDGRYGETHRGLDYDVALGTPVLAPGAGTVALAAALTLPGLSVAIDHGQGQVSVLCHLSRIDVRGGDALSAGTTIGLSGESGIAGSPHVHWALYLHGIAVDPSLFLAP